MMVQIPLILLCTHQRTKQVFRYLIFERLPSNDTTIVAVGIKGGVLFGIDSSNWNIVKVNCMPIMKCIVWYKNKYIAVGDSGAIYTSQTGNEWQKQNSGTIANLTCVYGDTSGSLLVAVGNGGIILSSTDGIVWTLQTSNTTANFRQVLFDSHDWVVLANKDTIFYSNNAKLWKFIDTDISSNNTIDQICTNGNMIVGVGLKLYVSTSCTTWTIKKPTFEFYNKEVCFWDGKLWNISVYGFGSFRSKDLINWEYLTDGETKSAKLIGKKLLSLKYYYHVFENEIYRDKYFITIDTSQVYIDNESNQPLNTAVWTGNQLVVAGNYGIILTSPDLINWTKQQKCVNVNLNSAIWKDKKIVMVGDNGTILTSENAIHWNSIISGTTDDLHKIISDSSTIITVGGKSLLISSDHGLTWEKKDLPVPEEIQGTTNANLDMNDIVWNGKQYIGLCSGYSTPSTAKTQWILVSSNKTDWKVISSSNGISFNNLDCNLLYSIFGVIIGGTKVCMRTYDGLFWEKLFPSYEFNLRHSISQIGGSNLQIVGDAPGARGTYCSIDPIYWTFTPMPDREDNEKINQIVFMGSYFVAVSNKSTIWISLAKDEMALLNKTDLTKEKTTSSKFLNSNLQVKQHNSNIIYSISQSQNLTLYLYSINGKIVSTLDKGNKSPGEHSVSFNRKNYNPGSYILKLKTEKQGSLSRNVIVY
jgi:photosystem II stability/assembly factor-like uncharacterized protein